MANTPSDKQLDFLEELGYRGLRPRTMTEASVLIESMLAARDSPRAEDVLRNYRAGIGAPAVRPKSPSKLGGCLVILLLVGGCLYWSRDPAPQPKPQGWDAPPQTPEVIPTKSIPVLHDSPHPPDGPSPEAVPAELLPVMEVPPLETNAPEEIAPPKTLDYKQANPEAYGQSQLNLAKQYVKLKQTAKAREILTKLIEQVPGTEAATAAQREIDRLP